MDDNAGAPNAGGEARGEPIDRAEAASYVAELSTELASLARQHGLATLAHILDMAKLEVEHVTRDVNRRR